MANTVASFFTVGLVKSALVHSLTKFDPRQQWRNPVMFTVYLCALIATVLAVMAIVGAREISTESTSYTVVVALLLWLTVWLANFAEALAESKGRAQAESLRNAREDMVAFRLTAAENHDQGEAVKSAELEPGDLVLVKAGEQIPGDGEAIEGAALVDESAITGESAPVIREAGTDKSGVTGGTKLISDYLVVRITAGEGESFLDHMIEMVEGATRQKTPNERALEALLVGLTLMFTLVCASLYIFSDMSAKMHGLTNPVTLISVVSLLVCLAPTSIGGLVYAIGIAGMSRLYHKNVIATSGSAVEAAGDVDTLLLDKTGTITFGNRRASKFIPVDGHREKDLARLAQLASIADETPEGRSIMVLARNRFHLRLRGRGLAELEATFIPFSATTKVSGVDFAKDQIRKGSPEAIKKWISKQGGEFSAETQKVIEQVASCGGTPLVVSKNGEVFGVVYLKDIVKKGLKKWFSQLQKMGISIVMVTGDNALTAAAIAAEAGLDDYLAEATPESKLAYIRQLQDRGHLVAMTGDGTNDAPALAQADVAVVMNSGTQAAKEAGNMVDLDSNPTKLLQIVQIGKQLLMTRGALTTFSTANDVAKYFAVLPVLGVALYPGLEALNVMNLYSANTAIVSALIYNALIIGFLIPLALRGVRYTERSANSLLLRNLLIYGLGGICIPFLAIKLIDLTLVAGLTWLASIG